MDVIGTVLFRGTKKVMWCKTLTPRDWTHTEAKIEKFVIHRDNKQTNRRLRHKEINWKTEKMIGRTLNIEKKEHTYIQRERKFRLIQRAHILAHILVHISHILGHILRIFFRSLEHIFPPGNVKICNWYLCFC